MAAKKKKSGWGGKREGSGGVQRVPDEYASVKRLLAFTPGEDEALQRMCPADKPLARWLVETLLVTLMVPCKKCGAPVAAFDGQPLYESAHACE
jgi:hypothetical protein